MTILDSARHELRYVKPTEGIEILTSGLASVLLNRQLILLSFDHFGLVWLDLSCVEIGLWNEIPKSHFTLDGEQSLLELILDDWRKLWERSRVWHA